MKPLVSIIIPVYNVEKYLDKCITSVVNQTYTNLEIILIDDGSPDNCPAICDQWQAKDNRIKVIHNENGGLSHARNEGLKIATGEFIGFVDSDDWIEPNMYELLLTALLETDADIAVCNFQVEPKKNKVVQNSIELTEQRLYSSEEALERLLKKQGKICFCVWNKLYRRNRIINILFPEGKLYEDILWTVKAIGNSKTIVCINSVLYHYLQRPESLSHNTRQKVKGWYDKLEMIEQSLEYIRKHCLKLEKFAIANLQTYCLREYLKVSLDYPYLDKDGEIRRIFWQRFSRYKPIVIQENGNIRKKIGWHLFCYFPKLLVKLCSIYRMLNSSLVSCNL